MPSNPFKFKETDPVMRYKRLAIMVDAKEFREITGSMNYGKDAILERTRDEYWTKKVCKKEFDYVVIILRYSEKGEPNTRLYAKWGRYKIQGMTYRFLLQSVTRDESMVQPKNDH